MKKLMIIVFNFKLFQMQNFIRNIFFYIKNWEKIEKKNFEGYPVRFSYTRKSFGNLTVCISRWSKRQNKHFCNFPTLNLYISKRTFFINLKFLGGVIWVHKTSRSFFPLLQMSLGFHRYPILKMRLKFGHVLANLKIQGNSFVNWKIEKWALEKNEILNMFRWMDFAQILFLENFDP